MPHAIGSMLLILIGLSATGCVQAKIQVVDQRTALENQILGSYVELDRDLQLVASVRTVDGDGNKKQPPRFSDIRKGPSMLAIQGGAVVGATDQYGVDVAESPFNEENLFATIFSALGIDPHAEFDLQGFPNFHHVENKAAPIKEVLS